MTRKGGLLGSSGRKEENLGIWPALMLCMSRLVNLGLLDNIVEELHRHYWTTSWWNAAYMYVSSQLFDTTNLMLYKVTNMI